MAGGRTRVEAQQDEPALRLEEFLPYRLVMLAEQVSQSLARLYGSRYGLTNPEWRVLATLGQFGRMTATEIGRHSRMHKTKVSRAVAELERKGCLRRSSSDMDLRVSHLFLTADGIGLYRAIVPIAVDFADRLAADLSDADRAALQRILPALMDRSEALSEALSQGADPPDRRGREAPAATGRTGV